MICRLAAYDPALPTPTGDYWAWRSTEIPRDVLERYHEAIEHGHSPNLPNTVRNEDLHGGCLALDDERCCFYRHYDGGRDRRGRPGRYVLLFCFVDRHEASRRDCSGVLDREPFASVDFERFRSGLTPERPGALECDFAVPPLDESPSNDDARRSWTECAGASEPFHWKLRRRNGVQTEEIEWLPRKSVTASAAAWPVFRSSSTPSNTAFHRELQPPQPFRAKNKMKKLIIPSLALLIGFALGAVYRPFDRLGIGIEPRGGEQAIIDWLRRRGEAAVPGVQKGAVEIDELMRRIHTGDWSTVEPASLPETHGYSRSRPVLTPGGRPNHTAKE